MHIAIHSASDAVTRALSCIIEDSGHRVVMENTAADLVLIDQMHPPTKPAPDGPKINLINGTANDEVSITCPFRPERLLQRLTMQSIIQTVPLSNGWSLELLARLLQHENAASVSLTEKECSLLQQLAAVQPGSLSRDDLLTQVWGMSASVDTHTLETHIYRLRAKLSALTPVPCDILTVEGAYRLAFPGQNG